MRGPRKAQARIAEAHEHATIVIVGIEAFELQPQVKICERFGCQIQHAKSADPYVAISPSMRAKPCHFFASALFQELNELAVPSKSGVKPGSITRTAGFGNTFAVSMSEVRCAKAMPVNMGLGERYAEFIDARRLM